LRQVRTAEFSYRDLAVRIVCQPGPGVFFRRDAFERAGPWDGLLRQIPDYEYWLRLGLEGAFVRIPEVLAAYRVHDRSQSFAPVGASGAEEIVKVISAHFRSTPPAAGDRSGKAGGDEQRAYHCGTACTCAPAAIRRTEAHEAAFALYPRGYLRPPHLAIACNGLLNRIAYKLLWQFKRAFSRG